MLISSSTRELVADQLAPDVALKDLGQHRLKDLGRPEHLFQVVAGGLPSDFPPLGALPSGFHAGDGLPASPNRTIGREDDVRAIADHLCAVGVRVLTLTGPGGVGKTRLALEAARALQFEFAAGARFVSLAALRRAEDVPAAIVQSLGIIPLSSESAEQAVTRYLSVKQLLLVIDNVEHVPTAAGFVSELLDACPALTVLATSRERLALVGEQRYLVAPLALPRDEKDGEALARVPAVALFGERARAHDPGFRLGDANVTAVAEICRRVDGLPLAIELAAARCGLLSPGEIAERLDTALSALGAGARDAPARHQTLRATVDWSHDLLADDEKRCFARLSVFAGGATVEAAEKITGTDLDTLDHLVAKSLLVRRQHEDTPTRLGMLETIRAYATERMAAMADADAVRENHRRFYLALAQRHGAERGRHGHGPPGAPRAARCRRRQPARGAGVGGEPRRSRTGSRHVRGARPLLANANRYAATLPAPTPHRAAAEMGIAAAPFVGTAAVVPSQLRSMRLDTRVVVSRGRSRAAGFAWIRSSRLTRRSLPLRTTNRSATQPNPSLALLSRKRRPISPRSFESVRTPQAHGVARRSCAMTAMISADVSRWRLAAGNARPVPHDCGRRSS